MLGEDSGEDVRARAVHAVDGELEAGLRDEVEVGEAADGFEIAGQEVDFRDGGGLRGLGQRLVEKGLDRGHDGGASRAAVEGLVLDAVPLVRVVAGGNHDAAGRALLVDSVGERGRGRDAVGELDGDSRGGEDLGHGAREAVGAEAGVVADADAFGGVLARIVEL